MKILSIVIVNWNTRKLLLNLLTSLFQHSPHVDFEVIVVDNASTDGSQEMIAGDFPDIKLLVNPSNLGFAGAVNRGIRESCGWYVLLLNTDMIVLDGAIDMQIEFMETSPDHAICGGALINGEGIPVAAYGLFPSARTLIGEVLPYRWAIGARNRISHEVALSQTNLMPVDFVSGATLMIRRRFFEMAGLLDEQFFMYFEDADWGYRAKQLGWRTCIVPSVRYIHFGAGSAIDGVSWNQYWIKSLGLFLRKHYHGIRFVTCWLIYQLMLAEFAVWKIRMQSRQWLSPSPVS